MSRIRSIHPGIWTDEAFVSLSPLARLLFIGLWNECDDKGTFSWSPLQMKMRVLPADNADAAELMTEIEGAGCIMRYEIGGKSYGAVRNFCKFQRPKKPNSIHPISELAASYVGFDGGAVPNQLPTASENAPQMEDGEEEEREKNNKGGYAFSGEVVRLTQRDFTRWERAYPSLDLRAALQSRDDWLARQPEPERKNWFNSTSNWLAKRQQDSKRQATPEFASPC